MIDDKRDKNSVIKISSLSGSRYYIILLFIGLITFSTIRCANIARPTGGPKDTIPPKILSEVPPNFSTNFKSKSIVIQFDEYIKLNNVGKEFSISPDVDKQPTYKVKKKSLDITLPDSLEKNTTYTINFGKGLVDYNEGNPLINYSYVFSTGPELDSLEITGSVKNAFTKKFDDKSDKDVRILLIPISQDSIFGKKKANIYTNVDSAGTFKLKNLREGTYRIYALKDLNNDRIYNNHEEELGFLKDSIVLNKNIADIKLEFSKGKPRTFRTNDKKIEKDGRLVLVFNQPIDTPVVRILTPIVDDVDQKILFSPSKDSAFIHLNKLDFDSIKFEIRNNNSVLDTTLLRRSKNEKYERLIDITTNINNKVDKTTHITLTSKTPIESILKEKLILKEDSIERKNFQLEKDSLVSNLYHIRYNWKAKKNYELILPEKSISGYFNEYNKEKKLKFTLDENSNYGDIKFTITNLEPDQQYIAEIIDNKTGNVIDRKTLINSNKIDYIKFPAGKYNLRIIKDLNRNGRWDGADIYTKSQAEPIWYLDKPFTIRPNWEQLETVEVIFD